jgi:serine/threonine-protein kinase HipA
LVCIKLQLLIKELNESDVLNLLELSIEHEFSLIPYDIQTKRTVIRNLLHIKHNMSIYRGKIDDYDEQYIQNHPDLFIVFQMPVRKNSYRSKRLFPFFDGLIPEGWLLTIAAESWRINKNDRMGLLLACCKNTIGAVSVHPLIDEQDDD